MMRYKVWPLKYEGFHLEVYYKQNQREKVLTLILKQLF